MQLAAKRAPLRILRPCDTRWTSRLYAAHRLYQLKSFVDFVIEQPPQFWVNVQQIIEFLKHFQAAIDVLQTDTSTLFDTYAQFKTLLRHVRDIAPASMFWSAKDDITNVILDMWEKHTNFNAIISCGLLSFDASVKEMFPTRLQAAEQWFFSFAAKYAQARSLSETTSDYEQLRRQVLLHWSFPSAQRRPSFRQQQ